MKRKQTRFAIIIASLGTVAIAVGLMLYAARDTIVFFYTPSEVAAKAITPGTRIRLGGLVENGSLVKGGDANIEFTLTDLTKTMKVSYIGQLPDLFREGQGVVAEGVLQPGGSLKAETVLAKHDEKYMPKDVADKLKAQGVWKEPDPKTP